MSLLGSTAVNVQRRPRVVRPAAAKIHTDSERLTTTARALRGQEQIAMRAGLLDGAVVGCPGSRQTVTVCDSDSAAPSLRGGAPITRTRPIMNRNMIDRNALETVFVSLPLCTVTSVLMKIPAVLG